MTDVVAHNIAVLGDTVCLDHAERSVLLQPRHEATTGLIEPRPPAIIVITEIVNVGCTRLDRHGFGGCDVVDLGRCHRKVNRPIGIRIVDDMRLGPEHIGRKCRPAPAQAGEPNTGGIDQPDRVSRCPPQPAMRLRQHLSEQLAEHLPGPLRVGVRHRRTLHRRRAHVIKPCLVACHPRHDLPQARRTAQLPVQQRDEVALCRQLAHQPVGPALLHDLFEFRPRNQLR